MTSLLLGIVGFIAGIAIALSTIAAPPFWQWVIGIWIVGPIVGSFGGFVGGLVDIWLEDHVL